MEKHPLNKNGIKELILQFNLDESVNDLKRYYSTPTTWDIIKQSRRETSHTQFLAWMFGNKDFNADLNAGPIKKLVVLLLKWSEKQKGAEFDSNLAGSIYGQNFSISSYEVKSEVRINAPNYGDGIIDILITCEAKVNGAPRNINIVIENKIDSKETTKVKGKKEYEYQTDAYYGYVTKIYPDDINIFVYLKPTLCGLEDIHEAECHCKKYIQLNYQELLDNIIQPISEQKSISAEDRFRLKDYIKTLGKPAEIEDEKSNKRITVMAMEKKEKELLTTFFNNNEDLIRAAIEAQDDCEDLKEALQSANIGRAKRFYTINNEAEIYNMYKVLEKFIEFRLRDQSVTVDDIDNEIKEYTGRKDNVRDSNNLNKKVCQEDRHYGELQLNDGRKIIYTKEWGDGKPTHHFWKFRTKVNEKYPNFQISVVP
jgi:hypothetical protein